MSQKEIEILQRALAREKAARKAAEKILEDKSKELYNATKLLQNHLAEKSSQLKGVFDNILDAYVVMDLPGNVLKFNDAATKLFGYDINKQSVNVKDFVYYKDLPLALESFFSLKTKGYYRDFEARIVTGNGTIKWVHINASLIFDKHKKPIAAQGIVRDITEEKQLKKQIEDQQKKLNIIVDNSPIGITLTDVKTQDLTLVNQSFLDMLGYSKEEFDGVSPQEITHPEDEPETKAIRKQLLKGEIDSATLQKRYVKKDGSFLWAKTKILSVKNNSGDLDYIVATIEDVTKEHKTNLKIYKSEKQLSTLVQSLDTAILLEDDKRNAVLVNNKFCQLFKINENPEDLVGLNYNDIILKSNRALFKEETFTKNSDALIKENKSELRKEITLDDGTIVERDYIPIIIADGYNGHLWSYSDVTLNRTYRKNLELQKHKYHNIIANMDLGLIEADLDGNITMVNQSLLNMSGYTEEEILGKKGRDLFPLKSESRKVKEFIAKRKVGVASTFELKVKRKNGETRFWFVCGSPNLNLEDEVVGSVVVVLDITDLKTLQLQKESLLGKLERSNTELQEYAHIVSHDLKSPLRSIHALVSWLKEDNQGKLDQVSLQNISLIENTLEKMEQLITDILEYSSIGSDSKLTSVNLDNTIEELLKILYIPDHITVNIKNKLPTLEGDATKLKQLFQNLISNAVKFIDKDNGLINIDVTEKKTYYQFSIEDNGIGIDKKFHDKIFKIFHSLNKSKDSTGVGLSIVKKIVDLHKGEIWLESELNKGTTFYFTLKK